MIQLRCRTAVLNITFGSTLIAAFFPSDVGNAQEVRAYRQVAYESGHGTLAVNKGPDWGYYALNRADRCVLDVFSLREYDRSHLQCRNGAFGPAFTEGSGYRP